MEWQGKAALFAPLPGAAPPTPSTPPPAEPPANPGEDGEEWGPQARAPTSARNSVARAGARPRTLPPPPRALCGEAPLLTLPRRLGGPCARPSPARGPLPAAREHEAAAGARPAGAPLREGRRAPGRAAGVRAPTVPTYLRGRPRRPAGGKEGGGAQGNGRQGGGGGLGARSQLPSATGDGGGGFPAPAQRPLAPGGRAHSRGDAAIGCARERRCQGRPRRTSGRAGTGAGIGTGDSDPRPCRPLARPKIKSAGPPG